MKFVCNLVAAYALLLAMPAQALEESIDKQLDADQSAASSQTKIDNLADQRASDLQRFRMANARLDSLQIYNQQLRKLIESQQAEIESIQRQTDEIENIETGALPLMLTMTDTLEELIGTDAPFLLGERSDRVEALRSLIDRADVTAGEKYRRIMEAYLVEVDYGRTIEAYRGELQKDGDVRTVDFLRIGRVGLYYQTLDAEESGRWNPASGQFEVLDDSVRSQIMQGIRVARKQAPAELLSLPVNSPVVSL